MYILIILPIIPYTFTSQIIILIVKAGRLLASFVLLIH